VSTAVICLFIELFYIAVSTSRVEWVMWIWSLEVCGRKRWRPVLGYSPDNCLWRLKKTAKYLRIADHMARTWTKDFRNRKQECQPLHLDIDDCRNQWAMGWIPSSIPAICMALFSLSPYPDWFWGPTCLLSSGCWCLLPWRWKQAGCEADHSPLFSAKVKNAWRYTSIPPVYLHGMVLNEVMNASLYFNVWSKYSHFRQTAY